jgi:phage shock protein PspC (stress-responsive transcriptional regulator)
MNKTVNSNIGGFFFHIDEDAYQKLVRYFDAVKRSLSNSSGTEEIMKDIEMRVAELLQDKQASDKHIINSKDIDEVIVVMGQPEDYRIDEEANESQNQTIFHSNRRKLYRDKDSASIGGVCAGLGHYFGVDAVIIKVLFLILFFGFGTGLIAYIVLWIAMPAAVTTSEKLEMTGAPVTISNIEKKVREEFDSVASKIKNVNDDFGPKVRNSADGLGERLRGLIEVLLTAFAKIIGFFMVMFSALALLGITIGAVFLAFSSSMPDNFTFNYVRTPIGLDTPLWVQGILFFFVFGIPLFFLLLLGLKLINHTYKTIGNTVKYTLLALWIICLGIGITLAVNKVAQFAYDGKTVQKELIPLNPKDTLFIEFKNNDLFSKNVNLREDFRLKTDESGKEVIYSNEVSIEIMQTDEPLPYIQIERLARGGSLKDAKETAERIKYAYKIQGNKLILNNYLLSDVTSKWRDQRVELFLYLPKGTLFKPDSSVQNYDQSEDDYFNLHYSSDAYAYQVFDTQIKCINCPTYENEYDDVLTEDIEQTNDTLQTVTIIKNGNQVIETKKSTNATNGKIVKDKDGNLIKID